MWRGSGQSKECRAMLCRPISRTNSSFFDGLQSGDHSAESSVNGPMCDALDDVIRSVQLTSPEFSRFTRCVLDDIQAAEMEGRGDGASGKHMVVARTSRITASQPLHLFRHMFTAHTRVHVVVPRCLTDSKVSSCCASAARLKIAPPCPKSAACCTASRYLSSTNKSGKSIAKLSASFLLCLKRRHEFHPPQRRLGCRRRRRRLLAAQTPPMNQTGGDCWWLQTKCARSRSLQPCQLAAVSAASLLLTNSLRKILKRLSELISPIFVDEGDAGSSTSS